jgi:hypothetical protein
MSKTETSVVHAYGEKLRQLQKENEEMKQVLNGVKGILNNALPTDDKLIILHKIKILIK